MSLTASDARIDRALRILRIDRDSGAESLAEALWLANLLPEAERAEVPNDEVTPPPPPDLDGKGKETEAVQTREISGTGTISPQPDPVRPLYALPEKASGEDSIPATLVTVRAADPLPNRLAIERALRPFLKQFPSRRLWQLDGPATAEASADRKRVTPVFRPLPERWFDVLLLVERSDAMEVWADTIRELQNLLGRHGAFRKARVLRFGVSGNVVSLSSLSGQAAPSGAGADPEGRRLCLFLTTGASEEWRRAPLVEFVRSLGRRTVVAIVQMLPERVWSYTALGDALEQVHAPTPGSPNSALLMDDALSGIAVRSGSASCVPVFSLDADSVGRWARFVMSPRRVTNPGVMLAEDGAATSPEGGDKGTAEERLADFRATATKQAFQLLRVLAGVPLTLPIMRLVQQSVSAARDQSHLAEVMLSGLIERITPADSNLPSDRIFYDFIPEIRELLLGTLSSRETDGIDSALKPVQERLRKFVEAETGVVVPEFRALVADPAGIERLPASARPFVEITRRIYQERGILPPEGSVLNAPETEAGREIEIAPVVLIGNAPCGEAVVSGNGRHVAALMDADGQTWAQLWERPTGSAVSNRALGTDGNIQLLAARGSDDVFVATSRSLMKLTGPQANEMLTIPDRAGGRLAMGSSPLRLSATAKGGVLTWRVGRETQFHITGGWGTPKTISATDDLVIAGFASGGIRAWRLQDPDSSENSPSIPLREQRSGGLSDLVLSDGGEVALLLDESGGVRQIEILLESRRVVERTPFVSDATAVAISGDGLSGAVGHGDGRVSIWDFVLFRQAGVLRQGSRPVRSVSVSRDGKYVVSASDDGLKSWDISPLVASIARFAPRQARIARRVFVLHQRQDLDRAAERIAAGLREAGHEVVDVDAARDYLVVVGPVSGIYPGALLVNGIQDLPHLLDELDLDPPGPLIGFPPELQNAIARPALEARIEAYLLNEVSRVPEAHIGREPFAGASVTLLKVLARDTVRRAFPNGIYWNRLPSSISQKRSLVIVQEGVNYSAVPENCSVLRFAEGRIVERKEDEAIPYFHVRLLSDENANSFLAAAGMPEQELDTARKFHKKVPLLVTAAAAAFKLRIALSNESPGSTAFGSVLEPFGEIADVLASFAGVASAALNSLGHEVQVDMVRMAARMAGDPPDLFSFPRDGLALQFARDFGWLLMRGSEVFLISEVRDVIAHLFPQEWASAHAAICEQMEKASEETSRGVYETPATGLEHARIAGGAARLEQFLRRPRILQGLLAGMGARLADWLKPQVSGNHFLDRLCNQIAEGQWTSTDLERVKQLISVLSGPRRPWPAESGIGDAFAQGIYGEGIRIGVPGSGCNPNHPEFVASYFAEGTRDSEDYGTQVCSVIAGINLGPAPRASLEPISVLDPKRTTTREILSNALATYLKDPPEIICLTLGLPVLNEEHSSLRNVITELVKRDVLVVVAAGNDGPNGFSAPSVFPEVLSVGSADFHGAMADHTSRGTFTGFERPRTIPDVLGYGVDVPAAGAEGYKTGSGTSFAAAYVAGIAALYAQAMGIRGEALKRLLISTADPQTHIARFALETDIRSASAA